MYIELCMYDVYRENGFSGRAIFEYLCTINNTSSTQGSMIVAREPQSVLYGGGGCHCCNMFSADFCTYVLSYYDVLYCCCLQYSDV